METKTTVVADKATGAFIEPECTIELGGNSFSSGGAWLCKRIDTGKFEGYIYANTETNEVTSWDGKLRIRAYFGKPYRHNFGGSMRHVWFTYNGMNFHGKYCPDFNECVHVKQVN